MKLGFKDRSWTSPFVAVAWVVVIILGVLQYRWSNQVSEATSIRLADSLQMSMVNWHLDFLRDLTEICLTLRADPESDQHPDVDQFARRYAEWRKLASYPNLISAIYILKSDETSGARVLRLNQAGRSFQYVEPPAEILALRQRLRTLPAADSPSSNAQAAPNRPDNSGEPDSGLPPDFSDRFYPGLPLAGWRFEPSMPSLVHLVAINSMATAGLRGHTGHANPAKSPAERSAEWPSEWMVIKLNDAVIRSQILPDLAQRYFRGTTGLDYQVAVIGGNQQSQPIYSSDSGFGSQEVSDADGRMDIFGGRRDKSSASPIQIFHLPSNTGPAQSVGVSWFPLMDDAARNQDWRLIVRHRRGGALGAFVADSRRRDLAISFGVLFLLVVSMAILIATSTRAQRLAKLQMDFVTAVSHELRTPLTVISSAADNISHGVVEGKQQLTQYGSVIGSQAKKLFDLVEQILLFASFREGHQRYSLRPLQVDEIVDAALSSTTELIQEAHFHVDKHVEPNLPVVQGDLSALSQCLQNLITNALKYGKAKRWIGVEARLAANGSTGSEVQISVADQGMGIISDDMPHIFEPFYRSVSVTAAQIHGTGLGLPLARSIAEAMKGRLTVESEPGRGSKFTLHLPCVDQRS